jgi:hypothetical protein
MITIWKFPLAICHSQVVRMPEGAKVISIQIQNGEPVVWAEVDTDAPNVFRTFFTFGTGDEMDQAFEGQFVGTYQMDQGRFVAHVYVGCRETPAQLSRKTS